MSTVNEITGDSLRSRPATQAYSDNYDNIFRKPKPHTDEEISQWKWVNPVVASEVPSNKPMESTEVEET